MAEFRSWDQFSLRHINLNTRFNQATNRSFTDDETFDIHDVTYDHRLELFFDTRGMDRADSFYGSGIKLDNENHVSAGEINAIYSWHRFANSDKWYYNFEVRDFSISAVDLHEAQMSRGKADDMRLFQEILAGDDKIVMSRYADWMAGYSGNDDMRGFGQNDTLLGGSGDDAMKGDGGNDVLLGGDGSDTLRGGSGTDRLSGANDGDRDLFVFTALSGRDTITDFENGTDRINIQSGGGSFRALKIVDTGSDVEVRFKNAVIVIQDIGRGQVDASDFIFG
jgi:Ca2+-binding RTX toxin-like protein